MLNDVNVWVIGLSTNQSSILHSSFQFVFLVVAKCGKIHLSNDCSNYTH